MADSDVQRDLGKFEAQIEALNVAVSELHTMVMSLTKTVNEAQGGWRMMMLLGGAASVTGALVHKFSEDLSRIFK